MNRYRWAAIGDVNAFFGLALDNIADLVLTISLLVGAFGFPAKFALDYMIPGTALGVVVGDLAFTWMAFRLARRTGRSDVTAMPLGLDTPSTIGMVLFVVGPAFLAAGRQGLATEAAAEYAWHIGMCAIVSSGVIKLISALGSNWVRRTLPRAGLLGSLAAIALVLISFLPLLEIAVVPAVGLVSLAVILTTLVARIALPFRVPGALGALVVGMTIYYVMAAGGWLPEPQHAVTALEPELGLKVPWPTWAWWPRFADSLAYLPVVIPFALCTVVGGIDCTESAAAAGDEYNTAQVIAVEGVATLVAGICGGVIQTTPYIGHPAYKAMGGRAAYTLAAAILIGTAGWFGYFAYLYAWIPKAAIFPILIFVGLEITAQSFHATPKRHYPAVAMACIPALAYLVMIFVDPLLAQSGKTIDQLAMPLAEQLQTIRTLSGGFIITSLIWASAAAALIDRRLRAAAGYFATAAGACLFGMIHSPFAGSPMFWPWQMPELPAVATTLTPFSLASGYLLVALLLLAWSYLPLTPPADDAMQDAGTTI